MRWLAVLFRSGLRISEALALFPKDLDPVGGSLRVLRGKGGKARTAPLPSDAAEAVDRWLDFRKRLGLTGRRPRSDLEMLLSVEGIAVVWPIEDGGFADNKAGAFA